MTRTCDGETFFGFTVARCEAEATIHTEQDRYEQYDFCSVHFYFYKHGHYPEDTDKKKTCPICQGKRRDE